MKFCAHLGKSCLAPGCRTGFSKRPCVRFEGKMNFCGHSGKSYLVTGLVSSKGQAYVLRGK